MITLNKPLAQPQRINPVLGTDKLTFANYWYQYWLDFVTKINLAFIGSVGSTTLVAGTITVAVDGLTQNNLATVSLQSGAGTLGVQYQANCTNGVLTITSLNADLSIASGDTSVVNYVIYATN